MSGNVHDSVIDASVLNWICKNCTFEEAKRAIMKLDEAAYNDVRENKREFVGDSEKGLRLVVKREKTKSK